MLEFTTVTSLIQINIKRGGVVNVGTIKDELSGITFTPATGVMFTAEELTTIAAKMATMPVMPE